MPSMPLWSMSSPDSAPQSCSICCICSISGPWASRISSDNSPTSFPARSSARSAISTACSWWGIIIWANSTSASLCCSCSAESALEGASSGACPQAVRARAVPSAAAAPSRTFLNAVMLVISLVRSSVLCVQAAPGRGRAGHLDAQDLQGGEGGSVPRFHIGGIEGTDGGRPSRRRLGPGGDHRRGCPRGGHGEPAHRRARVGGIQVRQALLGGLLDPRGGVLLAARVLIRGGDRSGRGGRNVAVAVDMAQRVHGREPEEQQRDQAKLQPHGARTAPCDECVPFPRHAAIVYAPSGYGGPGRRSGQGSGGKPLLRRISAIITDRRGEDTGRTPAPPGPGQCPTLPILPT